MHLDNKKSHTGTSSELTNSRQSRSEGDRRTDITSSPLRLSASLSRLSPVSEHLFPTPSRMNMRESRRCQAATSRRTATREQDDGSLPSLDTV
ncbi:hypothetical protein E2C01_060286 [Portunus trituberculatus]|uniref:Uncharacterized protein n=1 Tax=Portunus trituberculatus TaxID=210409 RepID=A0A5B7H0J5_PORTR|nr:hypothetical protein [Portunus trituberculatus]